MAIETVEKGLYLLILWSLLIWLNDAEQVDRKFLRNLKASRKRNLSTKKQLIVAKFRKEAAAAAAE